MCGGFSCSKNALALLNVIFLLVSFLLIGIASYAKAAAVITSMEIAGGIIASGLFLFLVAVLGLIAGAKHHQVLLFFYIIILFVLFIIQFSVSIACLAVSESQISNQIGKHWREPTNENGTLKESSLQVDAQGNFHCCGWYEKDRNDTKLQVYCLQQRYCVPSGTAATTSSEKAPSGLKTCKLCSEVIPQAVGKMLEVTGGVGLFFSFTEMLGVWLAVRFRNQKDPSANPSEFL